MARHLEHRKAGYDSFKHRSTFTYFGRNAGLYRRVLTEGPGYPSGGKRIMIAGPGPFEPFYAAEASPGSRITAVDSDPRICAMISRIRHGSSVSLDEIAGVCCNINDDGKPRPNRDLLMPERIRKACDELAAIGFDADGFLAPGRDAFRFTGKPAGITALNSDIMDTLGPDEAADVIFMCTLFINMRKELTESHLQALFRKLEASLAPCSSINNGILAAGTTPAGLHGKGNIVSRMEEAGLQVSEILVDNLLNAGGTMRGGYGIIARGDGPMQRLPSIKGPVGISKRIAGLLGGKAELSSETVQPRELGAFLEATDRTVLTVLREFRPNTGTRERSEFVVHSVDKGQLLEALPGDRLQFGLLR